MTRKLASLSFILVLISIMALKHPAFAYCLCEHKIITLHECSNMAKASSEEPPSCPHCAAKERQEKAKENCTLEISFDAGDFFWQDSTDTPHPPSAADAPPLVYIDLKLPRPSGSDHGVLARQNAPPPRPPLRAYTGIYRL
ncbi:hypothetical protein Rhal01_01151 [Rubritalea halochordaticola]|uniref:Uncharacterized protein n=1 Tax=Rubritalea halochordaticola TaxID=714537 RepID=A0ABP9UX85_9BACT